MADRKKLIVGNWKMNHKTQPASILVHRLQERIENHRDVEVVLCPSAMVLQPLSMQIDRRKFKLGAQNAYHVDEGPFTGEISAAMLHDLVHFIIVGHSERRYKFGETDDIISQKMAAVVRNKITPILCVGETAQDRAAGETNQVLHDQLMVDLRNLTTKEVKEIVIAYEPVWAISTGKDFKKHKTPTPEEIEKAVATIRKNVAHMFGKKTSETIRVIYGGSSNSENAKTILNVPGVDGLLPGGASLNYESFSKMVATAHEVAVEQRQEEK